MTINAEYNQLDPLLRASSSDGSGDVNDPSTGFSPYPGNINQLIVKLEPYEKQLSKTGGAIDEFVIRNIKTVPRRRSNRQPGWNA